MYSKTLFHEHTCACRSSWLRNPCPTSFQLRPPMSSYLPSHSWLVVKTFQVGIPYLCFVRGQSYTVAQHKHCTTQSCSHDLQQIRLLNCTKVQTPPACQNCALKHLPQSAEPCTVLGSKCIMALLLSLCCLVSSD